MGNVSASHKIVRHFIELLFMIIDFKIQSLEVTPTENCTFQTFASVFQEILAQSTN